MAEGIKETPRKDPDYKAFKQHLEEELAKAFALPIWYLRRHLEPGQKEPDSWPKED